MYITITDLNDNKIYNGIDNDSGNLHVALCEISYSVNWLNISEKLKNNKVSETGGKTITIPDGYYDFCTLAKIAFKPFDISAELNEANLLVTLKFPKPSASYTLSPNLKTMLGFGNLFGKIVTGTKPINMGVNKSLYLYLNELNTTENLLNGKPSNLLEIISTERPSYCEIETKEYISHRYKRLMKGFFENLNLSITNEKGDLINFNDVVIVLQIIPYKNGENIPENSKW